MSALKAFTAIVKREFFSYFVSPLAYVVLTAFLLIQGYTFYLIVLALNQPETPRTVGQRYEPSPVSLSLTTP